MIRYSVQPRDQIFVKGYGFSSFAENMSKNIGKKIIKNLSSKYSQKTQQGITQIKNIGFDRKYLMKDIYLQNNDRKFLII